MAQISRSQSSPRGGRPQSSRRGATSVGEGPTNHSRDQLKSGHDNTMSTQPAAKRDQFGSRHNEDAVKTQQKKIGRIPKQHNLAMRESAQSTQPDRGAKNKLPGSRSRKSGSAKSNKKK